MHIYAESPHSAGNTLLKNFDFHIYISDVFHNSLTLLYYRVLITVCDHQ